MSTIPTTDAKSYDDPFLKGMACLKAGHPSEGADLLRQASAAGHPEAQNQLARLYFVTLRSPRDLAALETSASSGDHVALFVLAMAFMEGRMVEKDQDAALLALRRAATAGNLIAQHMIEEQEAQQAQQEAQQAQQEAQQDSKATKQEKQD